MGGLATICRMHSIVVFQLNILIDSGLAGARETAAFIATELGTIAAPLLKKLLVMLSRGVD